MKPQSRFIKSILKTSQDEQIALPWQRGATRAAFMAKRKDQAQLRKSA
jgi:hypothetical protein